MARTGRGPLSGMGGLTALHYAARQGHMPAVKALVDAGANVNRISASDKTSRHADRRDQRPLRRGEVPARPRRRSRT